MKIIYDKNILNVLQYCKLLIDGSCTIEEYIKTYIYYIINT